MVYLLVGLTGSGKTTYAKRRLEAAGVVRLSVDERVHEQHGRYGVDHPERDYRRLDERNQRENDANALTVTPEALDDFYARFESPEDDDGSAHFFSGTQARGDRPAGPNAFPAAGR
ncbi:AAA family ATPase [Streptomyces shenzhenensis]|uniref:AAA family ATPase n=1 Tax=Streptomyces shenzhenensis TaxID=943815 RepID=UPI003D8AAA6B